MPAGRERPLRRRTGGERRAGGRAQGGGLSRRRADRRGADAGRPGKTTDGGRRQFLGKKWCRSFRSTIGSGGELAPRAWAEIAVASLLALNDPKLDPLVTAYCQQFGIGSRVASFLVLENENDYKRLNLEEERGKTLTGDLGDFLDELWATLGSRVTARQAFERFLRPGRHACKLLERRQTASTSRSCWPC